MKKVLLIFTTFFFVIGLTGCFDPNEIEEISEQYCMDNPESEICQGLSVGDLEDEAVINVFNTILDNYNLDSDTFCEDYFSVTNSDLLSLCRDSSESLFPEGFDGNTVFSVEKKVSLSTEDVYELIVYSDDLSILYTFTITLTIIDSVMYISEWEYKQETIDPTTLTVPYDDARAYFQKFLDDYLNTAITSEVICAEYFPNDIQEKCIETRELDLTNGFSAVLDSFIFEDEEFIAGITMSDDNTTPELKYENVKFTYDDDGNIVMIFEHQSHDLFADFEQFLKDLFTDFQDPDADMDNVCATYFEDEDFQYCLDRYDDMIANQYSITYEGLYSIEDQFILHINLHFPDETIEEIEIKVFFTIYNDIIKVHFEDDNHDIGLEEFIKEFLDDFQDPSLSINDVCSVYFESSDYQFCIDFHAKMIAEEYTLVFIELIQQPLDYSILRLEQHNSDSTIDNLEFEVLISVDDNQIIKIDFKDDNYDLDFVQFIQDFLYDFQDPSVVIVDFCSEYYDPLNQEQCIYMHEEMITNAYDLVYVNLDYNNDRFVLFLEQRNPNNTSDYLQFEVFFIVDGNDIKVYFDNGIVDINFIDFIEDFLYDFQDPSIVLRDFCDKYFDPLDEQLCEDFYDDMIANAYILVYVDLVPFEDHFILKLEQRNPNNTTDDIEFEVFFMVDGFDITIHIDFKEVNQIPWDVAQDFLDDLVTDFNDTFLGDDEFVDTYIWEFSQDGFKQFRIDQHNLANTVRYFWLYDHNNNFNYSFEFEMIDGSRHYFNIIFHGNDPLLFIEIIPEHHHIDIPDADISVMLDLLLNDLSSSTTDNICNTYFDTINYNDCFNFIDPIIQDGADVSAINFIRNGDFYSISFDIEWSDGYIETLYIDVFFLLNNDNILISFTNFGPHIPFEEKQQLLNDFEARLNDGSLSNEEACNMYISENSKAECISRRQALLDDGYTIGIYSYEIEVYPHYIDFAVYSNGGAVIEYFVGYEVDFYYNENGELEMELFNPINFNYVEIADGIAFIETMIDDFNDSSITDTDYCNIYGHLFFDCITTRQQYHAENKYLEVNVVFEPSEGREYSVIVDILDVDNDIIDEIAFHLQIVEKLDGTLYVIGHQTDDYYLGPNLNDIQTRFENFIYDFFDDSITEQEFLDMYSDGFYTHGIYGRQDIIDRGFTVTVGTVSLQNIHPFMEYHAPITLTLNSDTETIDLYFDVYQAEDGRIVINLLFDYSMPSEIDVNNYAASFVADLQDESISMEDFCFRKFAGFNTYNCLDFYEQFEDSGYTAVLESVTYNDYLPYFIIDFYDSSDNYVSSLRFNIDLEINLLQEVHVMTNITVLEDDVISDAYTWLFDVFDDLNSETITISDFCTDYAVCDIAFDGTEEAFYVYTTYVDYDFEDFFNLRLRAEIYWEYTDGSYEYQFYTINYTMNEDDTFTFSLEYVGKVIPVPEEAIILNQADAEAVFQQFLNDVTNNGITHVMLCDMYFYGSMRTSECVENRSDFLGMVDPITFTTFQIGYDEDGDEMFTTDITFPGSDMSDPMGLRIYLIPSTSSYYIEFLGYYYEK
jgi:hypothetical protein